MNEFLEAELRRWLVAFSVLAGAAWADPNDCVTITADDARLACFDEAFGTHTSSTETDDAATTVPDTSPQDRGDWLVRQDQSQLTDDKNVFVQLLSENSVAGRFGGSGQGMILLRCLENTTAVTLNFNNQFMSSIQAYGHVEYRLDDAPMQRVNMEESTDNMVLGMWNGARAIPFIKALYGHDRLVVRATPYNESPMTLTFQITGVEVATQELRETCNW